MIFQKQFTLFIFLSRHSGFKLAVVHHMDMPLMNQIGISIAPGSDVQIGVTPKLIDIDPSAKHFHPMNRECYLEEEFALSYLPDYDFRYTMSNCLFQALIEQTIKQCNCTPLALGSLGFDMNTTDCYGTYINCEKLIFGNMLYFTHCAQ